MPNSLATILIKLIALSTSDHQPHIFVLRHGLIVTAHVQAAKFTVRIARNDQEPSFAEWKTVCAALPESHKPPTPIIPAMYQEHRRLILSASWQLPDRLL